MKTIKHIPVICLAVLCFVSLISCSEQEEPVEQIRPVRHMKASLSSTSKIRTFSGVSEAGTMTTLSFRVGGIIRNIDVIVGQKVTKGQLIAAIDDSDAVLDYEKALAAEKNNEVQVETARSNLERIKGLYENNNVSLSEYEAAKNKFSAAKADHSAGKKNSALKKRELSYYKLYSPMAGIIVLKEVNDNENVSTGQAIVRVDSEDDIQVVVGIPERYISRVIEGGEVSVIFSSFLDKSFKGQITEVSYSVSTTSSTYPVKIQLIDTSKEIRPGMPANVAFTFEEEDQTGMLLVPANTVGEDTGGKFIFTVEPTGDGFGTAHKKAVEVSKLTNKGFQLTSGISDGEFVITSGIDKMFEGKKVKFLK